MGTTGMTSGATSGTRLISTMYVDKFESKESAVLAENEKVKIIYNGIVFDASVQIEGGKIYFKLAGHAGACIHIADPSLTQIRHRGERCITEHKPYIRIMFSGPAIIVFWEDGTKTVSVCRGPEEQDPVLGFLIAFYKTISPFTKTQTQKFLNAIWKAEPVVLVGDDEFEIYADKMEFLKMKYWAETGFTKSEANVVFSKIRRAHKRYTKAMLRKKKISETAKDVKEEEISSDTCSDTAIEEKI